MLLLFLIQEFYTNVGYRVSTACVGILTALFAVNRSLERSGTFSISQGIKILACGEAITDGIQNRGFAHCIHANQIGNLFKGQGIVYKVVPIDQANSA